MSEPKVNELTGEVTVDLAGTEFRLRATMGRLATFQAQMGIPGLGALMQRVTMMDAVALYTGMKALCTSGNADKLDDMLLTPYMQDLTQALEKALVAGLPEAKSGNAKAPRA